MNVTHLGKRAAQPGMKPGDLVNHNNTITMKTTPVKISWELEAENEWMNRGVINRHRTKGMNNVIMGV